MLAMRSVVECDLRRWIIYFGKLRLTSLEEFGRSSILSDFGYVGGLVRLRQVKIRPHHARLEAKVMAA